SAARMAARFACRETCHAAATTAAVATSRSAAWAIGYSAAGGSLRRDLHRAAGRQDDRSQRHCWIRTVRVGLHLADDVRWAAEALHDHFVGLARYRLRGWPPLPSPVIHDDGPFEEATPGQRR